MHSAMPFFTYQHGGNSRRMRVFHSIKCNTIFADEWKDQRGGTKEKRVPEKAEC